MWFAKVVIWTGAVVTLFGTNIPGSIFYSIGMRPFPDYEVSHDAITLGLCLLTGGIVSYCYEKDKNSNR